MPHWNEMSWNQPGRKASLSRSPMFGVILLLGLLAMTARPATDPDLWWHLRTGEWIVETGHVPHLDPFSFTRAGQPWVAHEWLSELIFYELWKHGGAAALTILSAIVTTAGFMFLYFRCPGKRHWAAAATVLGALASAPSWGVRPQMFTFTLASLLLWLIDRGEKRPALLFWIPPLFLLWLNLHAGFALALALLVAYGIGLILETALGDLPWHEARPIVLRILLLLLACFALVPLNPSGMQLYRYPLDTLRSSGMRSLIAEWFSPDFHQWLYRPLLLIWLIVIVALATSRSRPKGRWLIPLVLTALAALDAVRHIPIFVLVAMPVITAALRRDANSLHAPERVSLTTPFSRWFRPAFNGAIIALIATFALAKWVSLTRTQDTRVAAAFPAQAVSFLKSGNDSGRLFVYYDWAGYSIWELYPAYRVFVDGRADLYGDSLLNDSTATMINIRTGWREILDRWKVDSALLPPDCALAQALSLEPGWRVEYRDSRAIILIRRSPEVKSAVISLKTIAVTLRK